MNGGDLLLLKFYWNSIFKYDKEHTIFIKRNIWSIYLATFIIQICGILSLLLYIYNIYNNVIAILALFTSSVVNSFTVYIIIDKCREKYKQYEMLDKIKKLEPKVLEALERMNKAFESSKLFKIEEIMKHHYYFINKMKNCKEPLHYNILIENIENFTRETLNYKKRISREKINNDASVISDKNRLLTLLNLPLDTDDIEIVRKKYKKLIKLYHPDLNKEKEAISKAIELNMAYTELKKIFKESY